MVNYKNLGQGSCSCSSCPCCSCCCYYAKGKSTPGPIIWFDWTWQSDHLFQFLNSIAQIMLENRRYVSKCEGVKGGQDISRTGLKLTKQVGTIGKK